MSFSIHGDVRLEAAFPLLITHVRGPWNRELTRRWAAVSLPLAHEFAERGAWVGAAVVSESMMCTPEALSLHAQMAERMVAEFGMVAAAHVALPGTEGEKLMHPVFESMFSRLCPYRRFETLEDMRAWGVAQTGARS
ncbi:hypothetical protein [Pseudomarimonas arenosa]|uniref:SpoIIAA-like protein n=1 Tax=Pseudomarimonas arenosa TaxID=2774145 RepID=A0AAW3ZKP4_9GAMM|nr:hypothetical protein [Pseudomarimonas arenosa]MBD8526084.1 hypothetical protein [Pseudomarimonas arenosa]